MIGELVSGLDYSICAEIALVLFVSVFVAVTLRVGLMRKDDSARYARIPLEENVRRNPHG